MLSYNVQVRASTRKYVQALIGGSGNNEAIQTNEVLRTKAKDV